MADKTPSCLPLFSKASTVFSKVGKDSCLIASTYPFAFWIAATKAGWKCSFKIAGKGAVLKGVVNEESRGLLMKWICGGSVLENAELFPVKLPICGWIKPEI